MTSTPLLPDSAGANDWRTDLDRNAVALPEFGCYVALGEGRGTIFSCPVLADGSPEPDEDDPSHMNWGEVTAPEPEFVAVVNDHFGTRFAWDDFAGR